MRETIRGAIALTAGLVAATMAAPVGWASDCFPACRTGYVCEEGTCVAAQSGCWPPCRSGFTCDAGTCVAEAGAAPEPAAGAAAGPAEPREGRPPRFEVSMSASLMTGGEPPDEDATGYWWGGRSSAFNAQLRVREGGDFWLALGVGLGFATMKVVDAGGSSVEGDQEGLLLSAEQIYRVPLSPRVAMAGLDRKLSLDLLAGPYCLFVTGSTDLGAQAGARLGFYWAEVSAFGSLGSESGFAAGMTAGVRMAF